MLSEESLQLLPEYNQRIEVHCVFDTVYTGGWVYFQYQKFTQCMGVLNPKHGIEVMVYIMELEILCMIACFQLSVLVLSI